MQKQTRDNLPKKLPHNYPWIVMSIVMAGTMMAALDISIVNISIPNIMADFGVNVDDVEWVLTGYMIAYATLMPLTAWLKERVGYKTLFMGSLLIFTIGSFLCGMAWNLESLIGARIIQALGGGPIIPASMAMISEVFPPEERGKAIGIWGMGIITGPAIGPTLGGFLTKTFGWRSIFMVNIPIGVIVLFAASLLLIRDKPHENDRRRFDVWGFIFLSLFLISFLLALSKGAKEGWTSTYIITFGIIASTSFILFLLVDSQVPYGIIDLKLFKFPVFSICSIISVVRSMVLFGAIFLMPIFLQQQMGFDEMQSGLMVLPGVLAIMLFMPIAGQLNDRIGPMIPAIIGVVLVALAMFMYRNLNVDMSIFDVIKPMLIRGVGMAFLMAPIMAAGLNAVPHDKTGMASSMLTIIGQVGGSIGISLLTSVLSHRVHFHLNATGTSAMLKTPALIETFKKVAGHVHELGYTYAESNQIANILITEKMIQKATILSFQDAYIVGSVIAATALAAAFFLPNRSIKQSTDEMERK